MEKTAHILAEKKQQLKLLQKHFLDRKGDRIRSVSGFTIDISLGGNRETDIDRVVISDTGAAIRSGDPEPGLEDRFIDILFESVLGSISYWEKSAAREIVELTKAINE